jgi:hypothetical protein
LVAGGKLVFKVSSAFLQAWHRNSSRHIIQKEEEEEEEENAAGMADNNTEATTLWTALATAATAHVGAASGARR